MKIVVATGTFDLLHKGHISHLEQARAMGDALIVVVARDDNVFRIKHHHPVQDQNTRLSSVAKLPCVDLALIGLELDKLRIIELLRPDIIALGYDQEVLESDLENTLAARGVKVVVCRTKPFYPRRHKTSLIRKKVRL